MRKVISIAMCALLILSVIAVPLSVSAAQLEVAQTNEICDDFYYSKLKDGTVVINRYEGTDSVVEIPSTLDGYVVSSINENVFYYRDDITSVTIPDTVKTIGRYAFGLCINLETVEFGNSLTTIEKFAFYRCGKLKSVTLPDSITTIGDDAFNTCSSLETVVLGDSLTSIGQGAFQYCSSLKEIVIPDSVEAIAGATFYSCGALEKVVLGNSVKTISSAFIYCTSLKEIVIPDSVTSITGGAFRGCSSLESVTIPDSVTNIGDGAFQACTNLKSVTIPASVTNIGDKAFGYSGYADQTVEGFVISGFEDTEAHRYAVENEFEFNSLDENPSDVLIGDADLDGKLSVLDATAIQQHVAELELLDSDGEKLADIDKDKKISVLDATMIQMIIAELIPNL